MKFPTKDATGVTQRLSSNTVDSNETSLPHNLLLTDRQVLSLCKAFTNNSSVNVKLSKTQLYKVIQSGGFIGRLLGRLIKVGFPLMKNVLTSLAKGVLIPLGLTAAAADAGIHKKVLRSGTSDSGAITLIISNNEMKDKMQIVTSLKYSDFLLT